MGGHVFVGGVHRTGTSLMARWLGSHPDVTSFQRTSVWEDEGQHLQDLLPPARALGGPGRFAFHPEAHAAPVSAAEAERLRAGLLSTWEPFWRDAPWRLEKSPPNVLRSRLLQQLFPDARFVFTVRHPLAVALATRRMTLAHRRLDLAELVRHWCVAYEVLAEDRRELGGSVLLRLEDVARDRIAMRPAFALLGLEPAPPPEPLNPHPNARYRKTWALSIERRLRPGLRRRLAALGPRVWACGYDLFDLGEGPGSARR